MARIRVTQDMHRGREERWIEVEYDVELTWEFEACPDGAGRPRTRIKLLAGPNIWNGFLPSVLCHSEVFYDHSSPGAVAQLVNLMLAKLEWELQLIRTFGLSEAHNLLPAKAR